MPATSELALGSVGDTVSAHVGCLGQIHEVLPPLLLGPSEDDGYGPKTIYLLYGKDSEQP